MYLTSFQNVYMYARLTVHSWWTMFRFFLPISGVSYTGLLEEAKRVQYNFSYRREQTSTSKTVMEYVNESVLLSVY